MLAPPPVAEDHGCQLFARKPTGRLQGLTRPLRPESRGADGAIDDRNLKELTLQPVAERACCRSGLWCRIVTSGEGSAAARAFVASVAREQQPLAAARTEQVQARLERVLAALAAERVGTQHFASLTGYGHGDQGREVVDRVFARVLGAEAAAVRMQFVSGTHAIAAALFGVLRPGDRLLSITGRPYDTLEEAVSYTHLRAHETP